MKLFKQIICLFLPIIMVIALFAGCTTTPAEPIGEPTAEPTSDATVATTGAPTEKPTPTPTPAPTKEPKAKLTDEQIGVPFADGLEGVEVLYSNDYSDPDFQSDGISYGVYEKTEVVDGALRFPSENGEWSLNTIEGYFIDQEIDVSKYQQVQISFDLQTAHGDNVVDYFYIATFVGLFISNPTQAQPNINTDGIWFSLNDTTKSAVYGFTSKAEGGWPESPVLVDVPESFHDSAKKVDIVITSDKTVYVYQTGASGEANLFLKLVVEDDAISVYNGKGKLKKKVENDSSIVEGSYIKFFGHINYSIFDNFKILTY